jgi:hypothetical protein
VGICRDMVILATRKDVYMYCDTTLRSLLYNRVKDACEGYVIKE